jgi:Ca2+-binding RTX toxin-like protein
LLSDGFDTIQNATAGDAVVFTGGPFFYDFHYDRIGNDLLIGAAINGNYNFADTGSVTIKDHYAGAAIDHFEIDLGPDNNAWYNDVGLTGLNYAVFMTPGGMIGTDQGAYAEVIMGSASADTILGNGGYYDNVWAGNGDDSVVGGWGHDWLVGENGNDTVRGEDGDDLLQGRAGNDLLIGGNGFDMVYYDQAPGDVVASIIAGGAGADGYGGTDAYVSIEGIVGSNHNDNLVGDGAANWLEGRAGNDSLTGGGGDDTILGGDGNDLLVGGAATDTYIRTAGQGDDVVSLGDGLDVLQFDTDSFLYDLDWWRDGNDLWIAGISNSAYDWNLDGSVKIEDHYAGAGNGIAYVEANFGTDNLDFWGNDPSISKIYTPHGLIGTAQGPWSELITGDYTTATNDVISGGGALNAAAAETVDGSYRDLMSGGAGDDTIFGSSNRVDLGAGDTIFGGDWLQGGDGNDVLYGGGGNDQLRGDNGNDRLDGGSGNDEARYHWDIAGVIVNLSASSIAVGAHTLAAGTAIDGWGTTDTLVSIENIRGSHQADYIQGSAVANALIGLEGDDTILGGTGDDTIQGGLGADVVAPGDGSDIVDLGAFDFSADRVEYRDGAISGTDVIQGFAADQDQIDLDGLFDALGTATVDRGINSGYQFQNGNELWVNTDGNTGNGFEAQIATIQVTSGILDAGDVAVGTL